jgi:hypothetical protein
VALLPDLQRSKVPHVDQTTLRLSTCQPLPISGQTESEGLEKARSVLKAKP